MANKKKSFYFEDYTESELTDNSKSKIVKVLLSRVTFLSFIFLSLILIFSVKIIYLSLSPEKNFYISDTKKILLKKEGILLIEMVQFWQRMLFFTMLE